MSRSNRRTGTQSLRAALVLAFFLAVGFSAPANANAPNAEYEDAPVLNAADLLPGYLLAGDVFVVDEKVRNDGKTNHYTVRSDLGTFDAAGRDDLERVIQEIRAVAYLRAHRMRTGAVVGFNQGLKKVATAPYHKVKRVVFNPLYAIEAVPSEIADYAGRIATVSDLFKYGPKAFIRRSLGIDGARRDLARRLHVDDDTENQALREELKRVGWGVWAGGLAPDIGEGYIDLEYDLSTEVGDLGDGNLGRAVAALRREVFPRAARHMLRGIDVPKEVTRSFREHPHYSGGMREDIAEALVTMKDTEDRAAYVTWAMTLEGEIEARGAVRLAQVMALHHAGTEPVDRIHHADEVLLLALNSASVAPFIHDYLIWSEATADHVTRAEAVHAQTAAERALELWSLGEFSPRMRGELAARGYGIRMNVDGDYGRFERPRKGLGRLEQQYEQGVEEPIKANFREKMSERRKRLVLEPLAPDTAASPDRPELVMREAVQPASPRPRNAADEDRFEHPAGYPIGEVVGRRLSIR